MDIRGIITEVVALISPIESDPAGINPSVYASGVAQEAQSTDYPFAEGLLHVKRFGAIVVDDVIGGLTFDERDARSEYAGRMDTHRIRDGEQPATISSEAYAAGLVYGLTEQGADTGIVSAAIQDSDARRSLALGVLDSQDNSEIEDPWLL